MTANEKIREAIRGRKGLFEKMRTSILPGSRIIWFHASSMGEFNTTKPVLENIRAKHPEFKILLTFFSPTGYEYYKNYSGADYIFYMPFDTRSNAIKFLDIVRPEIAVFTIAEYWLFHLSELYKRGIRTILLSAIIGRDSVFFRWYGRPYRNILKKYDKIIVHDQTSMENLASLGCNNGVLCGNPLFDAVIVKAETAWNDDIIKKFSGDSKIFIAGSVHDKHDMHLIKHLYENNSGQKFLIVPHETDMATLKKITMMLGGGAMLHSECSVTTDFGKCRALIYDHVGSLAYVYRYGAYAYVGGGFYRGPHNLIEAFVYGIPVSYGPILSCNGIAIDLSAKGIGTSVRTGKELDKWFRSLSADMEKYSRISGKLRDYTLGNSGATDSVSKFIIE